MTTASRAAAMAFWAVWVGSGRAAAQTCTYVVSPASANVAASGATSTATITPSADGCAASMTVSPWIVPGGTARRYARQVLLDAPSGYWRLGESSGTTAADASPGAHTGTSTGGVTLGLSSAIADGNTAASFDGSNDYVTMGDVDAFDFTTALAVEAWVQFSGTSGWDATYGPIVSKYGNEGGYFLIRDFQSGKIRWQGSGTNGASRFALWYNTLLNNGAWHHIVGTFSTASQTAALYVDGALVGSTTGSANPLASTSHPFQIGAWHNGDTFGGQIDDVAVYDHALTASQIGEHYAARSRTGGDVLTYTVAPNPFGTARAGSLTIADQTVAIAQDARSCAATLMPTSASLGAGPSSGTVTVSIAPGCAWTASSNVGWAAPGATAPGYANQVRADGPLGYWRLDEGAGALAVDASGHDRLGTYAGGVTRGVAGIIGDGNTAASFDGSTGTVSLGTGAVLGPTAAMTLEAWITFTSIAGYGPIVSKFDPTGGGYYLMHDADSGRLRWQGRGPNDTAVFALWSPLAYHNGAWHHVVGTYDGGTGTAALYVDGISVASASGLPSTIGTSSGPGAIGGWYTDGSFAGAIDDVAIYGHALSPAQVAMHHALQSVSGTETIAYGVDATTTAQPRGGTLTIAGQPFALSQAGGTCTYGVSPTAISLDAAGGSADVSVTTLDACGWTAASGPTWMTVDSPSGTSSGPAGFTVATNTTPAPRSGTLTIAGTTVTVTQAACGYTVSPSAPAIGPETSVQTLTVTTAASCTWTASAPSPWLRIASPDPYVTEISVDTPVGHWRMNELSGTTAVDSSGHGHDGTYTDGTSLDQQGITGDGDPAARFDGATGHVEVPHDPALAFTGALSVEAWVAFNHATWTNYGPIVTKELAGAGGYYLIRDYPSGQIRWQGLTAAGTSAFGVWSPGVPDDGQWHHVVGTYDAIQGTAVLYLDGAAVASASGTASLGAQATPLLIAAWTHNADTFAGTTDDVAVYDHALTPARVAAHALRGTTPIMSGSGTVTYV
ncbi:MAG: hypothetical protein IT176_00435, partial [Acidobacteria bacterium]|nr:hypothetical protein [Acidobacteriota bacterium]